MTGFSPYNIIHGASVKTDFDRLFGTPAKDHWKDAVDQMRGLNTERYKDSVKIPNAQIRSFMEAQDAFRKSLIDSVKEARKKYNKPRKARYDQKRIDPPPFRYMAKVYVDRSDSVVETRPS